MTGAGPADGVGMPSPTNVRRTVARGIVTTVLVALTAGCGAAAAGPTYRSAGVPASVSPRPDPTGAAARALAALPVKGRAPLTGYTRARFGPPWTDNSDAPLGHNGCSTRDDVLAAQLHDIVRVGCAVRSGIVVDPYTATVLHYRRGHSTVDIDHVTALGDAWQTGAQQLSASRRTELANDPLNLVAVSASANRAKGDADAASWLPPRTGYRCVYVARQVAVKQRYALWVTPAERAAIAAVLARCPDQPLPH